MRTWKQFLEDVRPIFSYDFDGVLHKSMVSGTPHPLEYWNWDEWEPREDMHNQLRNDAKEADIVVVSKRMKFHQEVMWEFIKKYNLPVQRIFTTNDRPKRKILVEIHAIKHYDDDPKVGIELLGTNVEFVLV